MFQIEKLNCLDELIAGLNGNDRGTRSGSPRGLILEHLRVARTALLGAMHSEHALSLEQALESVSCIPEKDVRGKTRLALHNLISLSVAKPDLRAAL